MGAGIEPGIAAAELNNVKLLEFEVVPVDVGDLQFAAGGRLQVRRDIEDGVVVEVEPGHGPVRQKLRRLFDDIDRLFGAVEFNHAILARLIDIIGKDGCSVCAGRRLGKFGAEPMAIEHVVAEDQRDAIAADELTPENEGVRQARSAAPG